MLGVRAVPGMKFGSSKNIGKGECGLDLLVDIEESGIRSGGGCGLPCSPEDFLVRSGDPGCEEFSEKELGGASRSPEDCRSCGVKDMGLETSS